MALVILSVLLLGMVNVQAADLSASKKGVEDLELSEAQLDELKAEIPKSYDATQEKITDFAPVPTRFLLWTRDGKHIMWGTYANGHFVGMDNEGKKAWGIYRNGVFAGFQDGRFFYGRYSKGRWYARGLFGLRSAAGRYVVFPTIRQIDPVEPLPLVVK